MGKLILLDTNIYRQLGPKFYEHGFYKKLRSYMYSTEAKFLLTRTVYEEYMDFYKSDVLEKPVDEIEKQLQKLAKLEHFAQINFPTFSQNINSQIEFITRKLKENAVLLNEDGLITEKDLVEFLIFNRKASRKDNTKDYIIWLNVLAAAKKYNDKWIILISADKIFEENTHFRLLRARADINNLHILPSILSFLEAYQT